MPAIFFVYGLAFIILGVALLFSCRGRQAANRLTANSILIAGFGLLHGTNEWIDMWILLRPAEPNTMLHWLRFLLLPLSFMFLFFFAIKTIGEHHKNKMGFNLIPIVMASLWLLLASVSRDHLLMGEIWARYFLALPATFLTAYALLLEEEALRDKLGSALTGYIGLSAGAFIFYGMFAGLVVPEADFFPASLINTSLFSDSRGMPVQIFRTLCAITIAYGLTQALAVFPRNSHGKGAKLKKASENMQEPEDPPPAADDQRMLFETLANALDDGVCVLDRDLEVLYQNVAHQELLGDHRGRHCHEGFERRTTPCTGCPVTRSLEDSRIHQGEKVTTTNQGIRHLKLTAAPLSEKGADGPAVVLIVRDITHYQEMEESLFEREKVESMKLMAAGITHDLSDSMTTILQNIDRVKGRSDPQGPDYNNLEAAGKSCRLAQELSRQLLTFSKGGAPMRTRVCTEELLSDVASLSLSASKTTCRLLLPEDLWTLTVDEGQIAQVIHNLLTNAAQAMGGRGTIDLKAENVMVSGDEELPLPSGPYIRITVSDEGPGITAENMKRIFNPYFTTKPTGKGLGLTIAQTLVQKHGGHLAAESRHGKTTFSLHLPATRHAPETERKAAGQAERRQAKILVMDDQQSIRDLATQILTRLGHQVVAVADGAEAAELFRQAAASAHPFDLVILDLSMAKGPGGEDTMQKLLAMDPSVRAIVSSGYDDDPVMSQFEEFGFTARLRKPYTVGELSKVVNAALLKAS